MCDTICVVQWRVVVLIATIVLVRVMFVISIAACARVKVALRGTATLRSLLRCLRELKQRDA